jgi:WD40 repeat protein
VKRAGSDFEMQSAAFSRDGSRIVTAPRFGAPIVSSVRVCERHRSSVTCGTGRELDTSTDYHGVRNAVFAPNGRVVAAATAHGLYMFDVRSGHVLAVRNPGRDTTRVAFSRDGDYLALAGPDGSVRLYDVRGCGPAACHPRLVKPLPRVRGAVYSVSFSPDDTLLATGGADRIVRIWDWRKARPLQLRGHTSNIRAVSFDDSGKYLVSAGTDGATILWSVVHARGKFGGKLLELLHMHADRIRSAVFAPGSSTTLLTASDDGTARIYVCDLCRPLEDVENIAHSRLRAVDRPATWLKNDRPSG